MKKSVEREETEEMYNYNGTLSLLSRVFLSDLRKGGERSPPYGGGLEGGELVSKGGNGAWFGRDKLDDNLCAQKMLLMCIKGGTSIFEEVSKKNQPKCIRVRWI